MATAVFITIVAFGLVASAAYEHAGADAKDAQNFLNVYPKMKGTKLDHCALCHSGGSVTSSRGAKVSTTKYGSCQWCHYKYGYNTPHGDIAATLNPYGRDYLARGRNESALRGIAEKDSDGDCFTNIAEINAVRYPGDRDDDPSKVVAPFRIYTKSQLQAMPQHKQFMLMNTNKSGDYYAEYSGVKMSDLLKGARIAANATKITVYAPDGYSQEHPIEDSSSNSGSSYVPYVNGAYPVATYYYNKEADRAINTKYGWCDYSSPGNAGRKHGDSISVDGGLWLILALQADGKELLPAKLGSDNKLLVRGEGPFRVVAPQKFVNAPDQVSTPGANQNVIWPYVADWDHNAGPSSKSATIIKVEPLPAGTTDINVLEAGWKYIDQEKIVIYGALEQMAPLSPENGATNVKRAFGKVTLTWKKSLGADSEKDLTYTVEIKDAGTDRWKVASVAKPENRFLDGTGRLLCFGIFGMIAAAVPRRSRKRTVVILLIAVTGAIISFSGGSSAASTTLSRSLDVAANTTYSWRVTADGPASHDVTPVYTFTTGE
jgi:hypothetical protein